MNIAKIEQKKQSVAWKDQKGVRPNFLKKPAILIAEDHLQTHPQRQYSMWFSLNVFIWGLLAVALAEPNMQELAGTWSLKSNTVFTGSGFYDPVDELLIEPDLPGILYLFTEDGHYEEALYRVTGNPQQHDCPTAVLIYQHGTYELLLNGSLVLTPIAVDGRQLLLQPCSDPSNLVYSRYVQLTWFEKYQVYVDPYHGRWTLQIYQFDGLKMQPLYLAYRPPEMLPTTALNPTDLASETKSSLLRRAKRSLENQYRTNAVKDTSKIDRYWWVAVGLIGAVSFGMFMK